MDARQAEVEAEKHWSRDSLARVEDAIFLLEFVRRRYAERQKGGAGSSFVINVDAEWGRGKTFFLRGLWLEALKEGHPCAFVDAWKDDFSDDPYAAVVSEIEKSFRPFVKSATASEKVKKYAGSAIRNSGAVAVAIGKGALQRGAAYLIGEGAKEVAEIATGAAPDIADEALAAIAEEGEKAATSQVSEFLDGQAKKVIARYQAGQISQSNFKSDLQAAIAALAESTGMNLPFLIFIDELDRCRPTYAIAMLERIKHLFNIPGVVIVLATDAAQLAHSIKSVYGQNFDSQKYLQRFFSRTYPLPSPPVANFIDAIVSPSGLDMNLWAVPGREQHPIAFLEDAALHYHMSLREVEQCLELLIDIATMWTQPAPIEIAIMFPLLIGHVRGRDLKLHQKGWLYESMGEIGNGWLVQDARAQRKYSVANAVHSLLNVSNVDFLSYEANDRKLYDEGNYAAAYAAYVIREEIRVRFDNRLTNSEFSLLKEYPKIISHAHFVLA